MDILVMQVADDGLVVVRTEKRTELLDDYGVLAVLERRSWGSMNIAILRRKNE